MVVHDFAYADFAFDGYQPPSFLEAPGAKEVGVEIFSTSKSYNMPGWRLGFVCGNPRMIHALASDQVVSRLWRFPADPDRRHRGAGKRPVGRQEKSSSSIASAATSSWTGSTRSGAWWPKPKGTMFVWASFPTASGHGSLEFSKMLIQECRGRGFTGIGFGEFGERLRPFALVENEQRIKQALRGLKSLATA
jgi:alanine-synthesizing transaminase